MPNYTEDKNLYIPTDLEDDFQGEFLPGMAETIQSLEKFMGWLEYFKSVKEYGAAPDKTEEENKQAIQDAIADLDTRGKDFMIVIPPDINYGYERNNLSTHPDMDAVQNNIIIMDLSHGNPPPTDPNPTARTGAQVKFFTKTSNQGLGEGKDNFHDGNTFWWRANWHPAIMIMNDAPDAETDNYRASLWFGSMGFANWKIGQGQTTRGVSSTVPAGSNKRLLEDFVIGGNKTADDPSLSTLFCIMKESGFMGFNTGNPSHDFHFMAKRESHGWFHFEATNGNCYFLMETATKSRRLQLQDADGKFALTNLSQTSNEFDVQDGGNGYFKQGVSGNSFTTANLPAPGSVRQGTMVYDITRRLPLWSDGTYWKDATGATV
jgi:hypothetical protein